ncbi:MAG: S9 family peptidase [Pseudomonadota bacterium]|nr:S9 family peptidase [Pseudomonadota bacterium]
MDLLRKFVHCIASTAAAICLAGPVQAQTTGSDDILPPNSNLHLRGIPAIPSSIARRIAPYTEFTPKGAVSWHPFRRELIVATRAGNTTQLHRLAAPGATLEQVTRGSDPVRVGTYLAPRPESLVFARDSGGNEQLQIYRLDAQDADPVLLSDPAQRNLLRARNHARDRLLVESVDLDKTGRRETVDTRLTLLDPLDVRRSRSLGSLPGTGWGNYAFDFDDRRVVMVRELSATQSEVWLLDLANGARTRIIEGTKADGSSVATSDPKFTRDGRGLFLATDRDGEFQRLAYFDLRSKRLTYFGQATRWDVERIALSPDGRTLAVITNENGTGVLRLYDAGTRKELARPQLPVGTVANAVWHDNSRDLALSVNSPQSPGDVWVVDVRANAVERWTTTSAPGIDASRFATPGPISWKSFDGRTITGFMTRPPSSFTGPRPVLVQIHGGPEAQARPNFLGRLNYIVNEMGVVLIEPNVRGSNGYGKTFLSLDDGMKREDSVRDIGALLDWIATQPELDAARVAIAGGSYGGYMSLATATHYSDRIAAAVDVVGIANFVTFLERTESYRRDLRRVEYGDERDPAMREFLTRISPVNNAQRITKPLLVVHGRNDPRVPYTEAEQIVDTLGGRGIPVWYLLADNEGHGFVRKVNSDFYFATVVRFLGETLLIKD